MFMAVPQHQLIHQDRIQREPPGTDQALRRRLPMSIKDPFELLIEGLDRTRAQLVEDAPYFHSDLYADSALSALSPSSARPLHNPPGT
jgi:hypothetical protein